MLISAFYIFVHKPDTSLDFFILPLLFLLFLCSFSECLCSLLRNPGGRSRAEPPHYIACVQGVVGKSGERGS